MNEQTLREHAKQFNEAVSALIELEAMKAENTEREQRGESLAYNEEAFMNLLGEYNLGHNLNIHKSLLFIK